MPKWHKKPHTLHFLYCLVLYHIWLMRTQKATYSTLFVLFSSVPHLVDEDTKSHVLYTFCIVQSSATSGWWWHKRPHTLHFWCIILLAELGMYLQPPPPPRLPMYPPTSNVPPPFQYPLPLTHAAIYKIPSTHSLPPQGGPAHAGHGQCTPECSPCRTAGRGPGASPRGHCEPRGCAQDIPHCWPGTWGTADGPP